MIQNLKALLVVLFFASIGFVMLRSVACRFMASEDFERRRNLWFALTIVAFVSPSFWVYAAIAAPLMYWGGKRDSNPVALYVFLMHVVPPENFDIPAILVNRFFELSNYRLLAFAVLLPAALSRSRFKNFRLWALKYRPYDILIFVYIVLQVVLLYSFESVTSTLRREFLFVLDSALLYFVVSRYSTERVQLKESIAAFVLVCALMAPVAAFETLRHWLMYPGIGDEWGAAVSGRYLLRGERLRAQVSAGHSLTLGYLLAVASGLWLYLSFLVRSSLVTYLGLAVFWLGLIAAFARAPWLTAAFVFVLYHGFRRGGMGTAVVSVAIGAGAFGLAVVLPGGEKLLDALPFVGTLDAQTVEYRQRLAEYSWELIQESPFFGNPYFMLYLEDLRQGEGIIDLVNVYAAVAMAYGVVGLAIFLGPFVLGMRNIWVRMRSLQPTDMDGNYLGAAILAVMLGTAFFMVTGSFGTGLSKAYYLLIGFASAYASNVEQESPDDI